MGFGNLKAQDGLSALNTFLGDKSYVDGYVPSQADVAVFEAMAGAPADSLSYALRWYNHIKSYNAADKKAFPGVKQPVEKYGPSAAAADDDDDDDDIDLFGSDEEDDAAAEKLKADRIAAYTAKKSHKPVLIAKSNIILDVKPWDDETDMAEVEKNVRSIQCDGLIWGASKLVAVGYGIKKLQICCVVEDDKVGTDFLEESICGFEDLVQSMDVAAFNKI